MPIALRGRHPWIGSPSFRRTEKPDARTGPLVRTSMIGPSHYTGEEERNAAADWYAKQKPALRTPGGPPDLVLRGAKIYAAGLPDENVAACLGCHGPGAEGKGKYPRLRGGTPSTSHINLNCWRLVRAPHRSWDQLPTRFQSPKSRHWWRTFSNCSILGKCAMLIAARPYA